MTMVLAMLSVFFVAGVFADRITPRVLLGLTVAIACILVFTRLNF